MHVASFADIEAQFIERVHRMVWCNLATLDAAGRPRSRVVHTIWEGAIGWATTRPSSPKIRELSANLHVSLAYISDLVYPVYVDGTVRCEDDPGIRQHVWDLFRTAPPPLGFDPGTMYTGPAGPDYGVLRFTPCRIALENASGKGERRLVWRSPGLAPP